VNFEERILDSKIGDGNLIFKKSEPTRRGVKVLSLFKGRAIGYCGKGKKL
jgi:hypothetical protein